MVGNVNRNSLEKRGFELCFSQNNLLTITNAALFLNTRFNWGNAAVNKKNHS